ncbi:MAG: SDR family NAD(P)-dependent oxidoreductase [Chitinispirillaceae bacterium]
MKKWMNSLEGPVVVTGGAGFIGTNMCHRLLSEGHEVILYDNLSRPGSKRNLQWLLETHGEKLRVKIADVRDREALKSCVREAAVVFHFAAQVAVTTSLADPEEDFSVNLQGTLNLLEILRSTPRQTILVYTSTNKVYGQLGDIPLRPGVTRYEASSKGIDESRTLDFHSPYGCSKGGADQYVIDFSRTFGIPSVVFRMSCIYGPHQFGTEDQGWVAHFLISALRGKNVTLYGDGLQVRDILFVDDLMEAFSSAVSQIEKTRGQAFNIGGGVENTMSLKELLFTIEKLSGTPLEVKYAPWRSGDQKYYVSDSSKFTSLTGWRPLTGTLKGIGILYKWLSQNTQNNLQLQMEREKVR